MLRIKLNLKKNPKTKQTKKAKPSLLKRLGRGVLITLLVLYVLSVIATFSGPPVDEISLSQSLEKIKAGEVEEVTVIDNRIQLKLHDGETLFTQKETNISFTETLKSSGIDPADIDLKINNQDLFKIVADLIGTFAPLALTGFIFWFIFKQAGKAQSNLFSFGKSKARFFRKNGKATFSHVAGLEEAKEELKEVVDFLQNPDKYRKMGARTPKGVLLIGPSGTGKTLMARAVAGEAKVPFLHMAGSEFMEMLVGIGASRVRDLFSTARKAKKAIIFIDELDAIGAVRGLGATPGHGEREQTLNQLLVEMDGLEPNETIILLAATNRPDILDPALTRPGRFDRTISLSLPDLEERIEILKLHAKGKPFVKNVSWKNVARRTVGFSGADLENMLNEAAILAARTSKTTIGNAEVDEASIKVRLGPQKKRLVSEEERRISAYHEAGHAIVNFFSPKTNPVEKISIVSRGIAAGYTFTPPEKDRLLEESTRILSQIAVLMGGRAAEETVFKEKTTGAAADIRQATAIARQMVVKYGMSSLGPIYFAPQVDITEWGQSFIRPEEISPETQTKVDLEIRKIVESQYLEAKTILGKHRKELDLVAERLLEKETLERNEFERLVQKPA
ncbi:MAG: ATP-dependent zinc metalloprotease FtsH [Patescibacteria group bacterium]|nr:ATP-dependent zinc metalloprotease FtsH [Patescibacteria group bacterium]